MTSISISAVRIDGGTQVRVAMSGVVVSDYTEALANGTKLPPITVFFDGEFHWLADGFHRHAAHVKNGSVEIDADVREGTQRDAIKFSLHANETHGLRRTQADKRNAVLTALADPEWKELSSREIARLCNVSHDLVARVKRETGSIINDTASQAAKLKGERLETRVGSGVSLMTPNVDVDAEVDTIIEAIGPYVRPASLEAKVAIRAWTNTLIEMVAA